MLANCYLIAAALWVMTREWRWTRLLAVAPFLLLAHYLQFKSPDFADWRWLGDAPLSLWPIVTWPSRALNLAAWYSTDGWADCAKRLINL